MLREEPKLPISVWEIILLVILTPVVWYATMGLLYLFCGRLLEDLFYHDYGCRTIPTLVTVALVLAFDVGWIILVVGRSWLIKDTRNKVYLTVLVLTWSASFLMAIYLVGALRRAFA
ncbi:MAG: hypothetical protein ACYTEL_23740 [Planctomycetota bacterium]|jgi:hypothetical protein